MTGPWLRLPDYLKVVTTDGLKWAQILATYSVAIDGELMDFTLHKHHKDARLMVTEFRTGSSIGWLKGAWQTDRKITDRYATQDLRRFLQEHVEAKRRQVSDARIRSTIAKRQGVNHLSGR